MEGSKFPRTDNSLINRILQQYRDCSTDSISGPRGATNNADRVDLDPKHRDVASREGSRKISYTLRMPQKDQNDLKFKETLVDGISVACFSFGGEKRLCFNEIMTKVLKDYSPQEISLIRERLQIHCPRCSPQQLEMFKLAGVVPWPCSAANLISKSDAFRLFGSLASTRVPRRATRLFSVDSLEVYHECFGGCAGTLEVEMYKDPYSNCITCSQCDGVFSPRTFVTHNHSSGEIHTCHWGFDSAKWRLYLMLCNEHPTLKMQKLWEMLTSKPASGADSTKRKGKNGSTSAEFELNPFKKQRISSVGDTESATKDQTVETASSGTGFMSRRSAFRPWSPLQNRVKSEGLENSEKQGSPRHPIHIPARIFAPHTIPFVTPEYSTSCSNFFAAPRRREIKSPETFQAEEPVVPNRIGEITSTPSTRDPQSLEKTAKEMVEVARNEKWEAFSSVPSKEQSSPRNVSFLEGLIYQTLLNCIENGQLPSARALSSLLAQDLQKVLGKQGGKLPEMTETKEKELAFLKQDYARKMEEAYDELKNTKKDLRTLEAKHREESQELNAVICRLKHETKVYMMEKDERLSRNYKKETIALQQEIREMSTKLEDKESYCKDLQNELKTLRGWINSQAMPVMYSVSNARKDSESVIRTLHLVNGTSASKHLSKSNGVGPSSAGSSEEES